MHIMSKPFTQDVEATRWEDKPRTRSPASQFNRLRQNPRRLGKCTDAGEGEKKKRKIKMKIRIRKRSKSKSKRRISL
jgi:hypothetical protein